MLTVVLVLAALGCIALIVGGTLTWIRHLLTKDADYKTTGEIVDITADAASFNRAQGYADADRKPMVYVRVHSGSRHSAVYHLVFTYSVYGNQYARADHVGYSKSIAKKKIGQKVDVYYGAEDPTIASIGNWNGIRVAGSILLGGAAVLLIGALVLWLV